MFGRKKLNPGTIDCLIGAGTAIQGDVRFRGGLRIDGEVRGNVIAEDGAPSMLVLSENARVEGQVQCPRRGDGAEPVDGGQSPPVGHRTAKREGIGSRHHLSQSLPGQTQRTMTSFP